MARGCWFGLCAVLLGFLAACGPQSEPAGSSAIDEKLAIVATTGMIGDVVERVAGERGEVDVLMGAGIDPHLYQPTRDDMAALLAADVVFYNGLLLEGRMTDALVRAASADRGVFAVTELIDPQYLVQPEDMEGKDDPHVWMDPTAWAKAVEVVRDRLIERDPDGESVYTANAAALLDEIAELDAYCQRVLESVPEAQRVLVTAHDAFGYFGRRYGYEVLGIQGLSTESEAGVRDVERLVDVLVDRQVAAVFVESTVSERNIKALIAGAAARGHTVAIGGELFSDAMGPAGTFEGTYVGMIDHNATTIARALGGEAPEGGMQGKLSP
ncbi:MAG: zinc ABC transporter substrate-binding protein [Phycisphaerales bacterium]